MRSSYLMRVSSAQMLDNVRADEEMEPAMYPGKTISSLYYWPFDGRSLTCELIPVNGYSHAIVAPISFR